MKTSEATMKTLKVMLIILFIAATANAQGISTNVASENETIHFGFEIDALPFIFGGYYASAWTGIDDFRFRAIVTKINQPGFVTNDGFEDLKTNAYAFLVDYFPFKKGNDYAGLWLGVGAEYWDNTVTYSAENVSGDFDNYIFTAGAGYVIKIWKNLYVNPWGAFHLRVGGDASKQIGTGEYESKRFLTEVSVKLGWYF